MMKKPENINFRRKMGMGGRWFYADKWREKGLQGKADDFHLICKTDKLWRNHFLVRVTSNERVFLAAQTVLKRENTVNQRDATMDIIGNTLILIPVLYILGKPMKGIQVILDRFITLIFFPFDIVGAGLLIGSACLLRYRSFLWRERQYIPPLACKTVEQKGSVDR